MKLDQAREERRLAQLDVKRAEEKREQFTLRSPIDGLVTQRYLNPGESVKDRPITQIAQIDPLRVEIIVPVTHFGALQKNQRAKVPSTLPGRNRSGGNAGNKARPGTRRGSPGQGDAGAKTTAPGLIVG